MKIKLNLLIEGHRRFQSQEIYITRKRFSSTKLRVQRQSNR